MSKIEVFSITDVRPGVLITNISRLTGVYTVVISLEENGHFIVNTTPDLNATDKTTLTTLCGKVGIVVITP